MYGTRVNALTSTKLILQMSSPIKKKHKQVYLMHFFSPENFIPGEHIKTVHSYYNFKNAYLYWWNMRMGNKSMDILNLWQILLWYMNQLWTCDLIGNVWRAVLLWRCIFILVAIFLKKTIIEKKSVHHRNVKRLSRKPRSDRNSYFPDPVEFKAIKSRNKSFI